MRPRDVVVVGGSTAGATFMREVRRRGFDGRLVLLDPADGTNRPPLSKGVLTKGDDPASVLMDHTSLGVEHVRSAARSLDPDRRVVLDEDGEAHPYDTLVIASGSRARSIAAPGQEGELLLRTTDDAVRLRTRLERASSVVVVGAGFLGLEVATAAARAGAQVCVVDVDPPLQRLLGPSLATRLTERASGLGIEFRRGSVALHGSPVTGVRLADGTLLEADVVVSCVGDVPNTEWAAGTDLAAPHGLEIDERARTLRPDVLAVGDVAAVRTGSVAVRGPFWANAVAQGRVAAATVLDEPAPCGITDDYFWTEIAGVSLKAVGALPLSGEPEVLEEGDDDSAILAWGDQAVVAYGMRRSLPQLRGLARGVMSG